LLTSAGPKVESDIYQVAAGESRLAIALAPSSGTAILIEYKVDPTKTTTLTQSQPFHELNVALYVSSRPDPHKLALSTTTHLPLAGPTSTADVTVGADTWLVVASARDPLSGDLAQQTPAFVLGAVLVIGIAITAVVEAVGRRRDYAMAMVADRTTALQRSLGELETTQQKLVASERLAALGQMAATVGHELRNPLGVLTNSMYLIRNKVSDTADDKLRRQLDTADREIAAATLIVSDLLEFARPRTANPVSIDVVDLLDESVSVAPPPTGIEVEVDRHPVPPVFADRDQIRQVILNLLTNAYEAMPNGGTARLSARQTGDKLEIVVADSGTGIDDETLSRVFEPFFSKKTKGTGLGLAVSRRIVEAHDGALTIESTPGRGCTATISLPLASVSTVVAP
jgi:signal transduction histidine kinase